MPVNYYLEDNKGRLYGPGVVNDTRRSVTFEITNPLPDSKTINWLARHDTDNDIFDQLRYQADRRPTLNASTKTIIVMLPASFIQKDLIAKGRPADARQDDLQAVWKMI